jgi:hypothetical protein
VRLAELLDRRDRALARRRREARDRLHAELVKQAVRTATTTGGRP